MIVLNKCLGGIHDREDENGSSQRTDLSKRSVHKQCSLFERTSQTACNACFNVTETSMKYDPGRDHQY